VVVENLYDLFFFRGSFQNNFLISTILTHTNPVNFKYPASTKGLEAQICCQLSKLGRWPPNFEEDQKTRKSIELDVKNYEKCNS
jgi:hypothetical protein